MRLPRRSRCTALPASDASGAEPASRLKALPPPTSPRPVTRPQDANDDSNTLTFLDSDGSVGSNRDRSGFVGERWPGRRAGPLLPGSVAWARARAGMDPAEGPQRWCCRRLDACLLPPAALEHALEHAGWKMTACKSDDPGAPAACERCASQLASPPTVCDSLINDYRQTLMQPILLGRPAVGAGVNVNDGGWHMVTLSTLPNRTGQAAAGTAVR